MNPPVKKVSNISNEIFTLLSKKKSVSATARRLKKSRQTIINHIKLLQNNGFLTKAKNPTTKGKKFFTNYSYTPKEKEKIHLHKLQIYSKVIHSTRNWKNKRVTIQDFPKYKNWFIKNNRITEFFIESVRLRATPNKVSFYFSNVKSINATTAHNQLLPVLFHLKAYIKNTFSVDLSSNFFIVEQELASQADQIAQVVNQAKDKGHFSSDGRYILEIYDSKKEKRAHVDLSELDEFDAVHARHGEDDIDNYMKHLSDAKKNNLKKQLKDWMLYNPPTLSYQYKQLKSVVLRVEAQDEVIKKLEDINSKLAESLYLISENLAEIKRK